MSDPEAPQAEPIAVEPGEKARVRVLLASILLVALCSITYELIIGTVSSYLLGNSVYQFSLTIGLYMSAMGLGSYLSRFVRDRLLERFLAVEIAVGAVGGASSALLFGVFTFRPELFSPVMWALTIAIGALVGLEIPLLTRYVRRWSELKDAIANVLSWDYIGALIGSLAFPLLLLPAVGVLNSAALIGLINIAVAAIGLAIFGRSVRGRGALWASTIAVGAGLIALFLASGAYDRFLDKRLFQDPVVLTEQTPYQKLTVTSWRDRDVRLYINGNIQFSSADEYRYHEALVRIPLALRPKIRSALILGGGDGLALRELLEGASEIERVVLVDLDPRVTELARQNPIFRRLNEGALDDERVEVVHADAMNYLIEEPERFDLIVADLPDPNNESLTKLYSIEFYRLARRRLAPGGLMVTQSTAAYFAPRAFWSIHRTMERAFCPASEGCDPLEGERVVAYHALVPSFGDWGFNLASADRALEPERLGELTYPGARFLDGPTALAMLNFPPDMAERDVRANRLIEPVLLEYYLNDWRRHNQ